MRKVTLQIVQAFEQGKKLKIGNTETDGKSIWLHGNEIAKLGDDGLYITNAGWQTNTTKERLNGLRGVNISQKNYIWYLNSKEWNGKWINVESGKYEDDPSATHYQPYNGLKAIAGVMALGNIIGNNQKEKNDWKERMLKAGLENKGLIMPDDWNELSEDTKQARLDGAIKELS